MSKEAVTNLKTHDDRRLVRRLLDRDDQAFEEFFEAMYPALYRFALARLGHDADAAEEVAQSALFRVVAQAPHLPRRGLALHLGVHVLPSRNLRVHQSAPPCGQRCVDRRGTRNPSRS